jgi:hypothetical protein
MSDERHWLDFEIHLSDQALVEEKQADRSKWNMPRNDPNGTFKNVKVFGIPVGGTGYLFAGPERTSREYSNATIVKYGEARPVNPPYITSPWLFPVSSPDRLPTNVDYFQRKSGGWFGIHALFGDTDTYTWRGKYIYTPSTTPVDGPGGPGTPFAIRQRRWADGFELPSNGAGSGAGENALGQFVLPDASRHPEGYGLRLCEPINGTLAHTVNEHRTGLVTKDSWERMYVRIWSRPTAAFEFWQADNSGGGLNAVGLQVLPSGQLAVIDITNAGVRNVMGTTAEVLELGRWYRLDMLFGTGDATTPGFNLYINRALSVAISAFPPGGWGVAGNHAGSHIGNALAVTAGICMDIDDWICADRPSIVSAELSLDWLNGSKVVGIRFPDGYGPGHALAGWGANRAFFNLASIPALDELSTEYHTTGVAGTVLEATYDGEVLRRLQGDGKAIKGIVALTLGVYQSANPGSGPGSLTMQRNGGAFDAATAQPAVSASLNWDHHAYLPTGLTAPEDLTALTARFTAGTGAFTKTVVAVGFSAEMLGFFDEADELPTSAGGTIVPQTPSPMILHNWPWDRTPWTYNTGTPPQSPVIIKSGTFVGNDAITTLTFKAPVCWLRVRRVTGPVASNAFWWSTMSGAVRGVEQPSSPEQMIQCFWRMVQPPPGAGEDQQEAECVIKIAGLAANASGVTYHYTAFMDPGMRFTMNGAIHHNRGSADRSTALFKPTFLSEFAIFHRHTVGGTTNVAFYNKGLGHAADDVNRFDNVVTAAALNVAAGLVNSKSAFVAPAASSGDHALPFNLWRQDDGSGDPGVPNTVRVFTYTGDGAASRTLALNGTTKRPLWAMVVAHNGTTITRDPAMTGTTSYQFATADTLTLNAATGITAGGVGSMTVGSALNANGVIYEVLVIIGGDTAGNNGWSADGEFAPVEPVEPQDWPDDDEPIDDDVDEGDLEDDDDDDDGGDDDGGGGDPGGEDFGTQCVAASQKVCKVALSHIGISEPLVDVVTDDTPQAELCRLHYEDSVNECLRDFPWDFATRYADLTYVAGSEEFGSGVNDDWSYSYRVPADCLFPRRLVRPEKRRDFDPDPPPFRQTGADTTGRLLLTNWRDPESTDDAPEAQLEYTYRPGCAAGQGDALFRLALSWLLASKLAPSLSRNKVTAADAWGMYLHTTNRAATVNARAQQQTPNTPDAEWIRGRE